MRIVVAVAIALFLCACGGSHGWTAWRSRGVAIRVPPGWHATSARLTPVTWPVQFLAVGSYPLPSGDRGADGCEPKAAVDRLPADGALLYGWEYTSAPGWMPRRATAEFPRRPRRFRLVHLGRYECLDHSYLLRFRAAGRYFQVHVLLGRRASARTRALALGVLDSLVVKQRAAP